MRWVVGDTTSGTGAEKQVHILAKPFAAGLKTNLVITTDRRSYHLELESTDHTYMAALSWTYPNDELIALKQQNDEAKAAAPLDTGISLSSLNFDYTISGDNPSWKPLRAFDDGRHVYIEFPATLDRGEAPPLFVIGEGGSTDLVNYRVRDNYYIVDQIFAAAELRLGKEKQQIVRITREQNAPLFEGAMSDASSKIRTRRTCSSRQAAPCHAVQAQRRHWSRSGSDGGGMWCSVAGASRTFSQS